MKSIVLPVMLLLARGALCQGITPAEWGLETFRLDDPDLGTINYYVTKKGIDQDKPLLFLISGCRGLPTMLVVKSGERSLKIGTVPPDLISGFANRFHVAFIDKAGTPFCDTMEAKEIDPIRNLEDYQPSEEYIQRCGLEWETEASLRVIDELSTRLANPTGTIGVVGFSEGGQLAVRIAAESETVTHLVSVISVGLNQFYSNLINTRTDAAAGRITHAEAQAKVEELFETYRKIYRNPYSTEDWYDGHPYRRWGSFCDSIPLEDLTKLEIPILLVSGSADRNSPILQTDYVMLEFIRLGKDNLTYRVFPGCDHSFTETVVRDGQEEHISHRKEVLDSIAEWLAAD